MGIQAIELYHLIPERLVDEVTHLCLLNACSHAGLVDQARSIFENIQIKSEFVFTTMVWKLFIFLQYETNVL